MKCRHEWNLKEIEEGIFYIKCSNCKLTTYLCDICKNENTNKCKKCIFYKCENKFEIKEKNGYLKDDLNKINF